MTNHCGSCTMCCKVMGVTGEVKGVPIKKPRAGWCEHCAVGVGCKVYEDRPTVCREFKCVWLQGREAGEPLAVDGLRPDHCGVVFSATTKDMVFGAHMDRNKPDAWRRGPAWETIQTITEAGGKVTLDYGDYAEIKIVLTRKGGKVVETKARFSKPDSSGMQWYDPKQQQG